VIQFPGLEIGDNKDENQELRNTQLQDSIAMISISRNHADGKGTQSLSKENSGIRATSQRGLYPVLSCVV
jgi:hypothetical protein